MKAPLTEPFLLSHCKSSSNQREGVIEGDLAVAARFNFLGCLPGCRCEGGQRMCLEVARLQSCGWVHAALSLSLSLPFQGRGPSPASSLEQDQGQRQLCAASESHTRPPTRLHGYGQSECIYRINFCPPLVIRLTHTFRQQCLL